MLSRQLPPELQNGPLRELTDGITEGADTVLADPRFDTPQLRAEGTRYLTRLLAGAITMSMEAWDPDYPRLVKMLSPYVQYGDPAADCTYLFAPIHGRHSYRITGTAGTARLFDIETWAGHPAYMHDWKLAGKRSTFEPGPNGELDIVLSRDKQGPNWIDLPEDAGCVMIRQYYYDWDNETPARLVIEREGAGYPPPPLDPDSVALKLKIAADWMRILSKGCKSAAEQHYSPGPLKLEFKGLEFAFASLQYGRGYYRCAPDEAVIVETEPPDSVYWGYQLLNQFWEAGDWDLRQTSINGRQAVLDEDGLFRAVISHTDPGVPNWLDTAGRATGLIVARYYEPPVIPPVTMRTVPLEHLRSQLPASTPTVAPADRQASLRSRRLSVPRRLAD